MEDPPGFERIEIEGERPVYYLKPVANVNLRKKFTNASQVVDYLKMEKAEGRHLSVSAKDFNFRKRKADKLTDNLAKRMKTNTKIKFQEVKSAPVNKTENPSDKLKDVSEEAPKETKPEEKPATKPIQKKIFQSENLLNDNNKINHKQELAVAATELDACRRLSKVDNTEFSEEIRNKILSENSLEGAVEVLSRYDGAFGQMCQVVQDKSLQELLLLSETTSTSPLETFPNDITKNWFSEVTKFAVQHSPVTAAMLASIIIKEKRHNVEPSHVLQFAPLYADLSRSVNKGNNAHQKMTTLLLKMGGATDDIVDALAKQNFCVTAECLRVYRDNFAEVAEWAQEKNSLNMPSQFCIDNCDTKKEHLTVEYIETETIDTSNLCTEPMSPDEAKELFCPEIIMLGNEAHVKEKEHLSIVVATSVGRAIGKLRPDTASILLKNLPKHHKHKHSDKPIVAAQVTLVPPHYYQETSNSEMISLAEELQRKKLWSLSNKRPQDEQFRKDLVHIYRDVPGNETTADKECREMAEYRVERSVQEAGELIGSGDLLTVKMFQTAFLLRSSSVRAVDRLIYLGTFRLQLFHLIMNKTALDIQKAMPIEKRRTDEGSLGHIVGAIGVSNWFSNKKKKIVRETNYEKHSQVTSAFQLALLGNLFDNYMKKNSGALDLVTDMKSAIQFVQKLMEDNGVFYYWDPTFVDPLSSIKCDLLRSSRDQLIRLVIDLAFRQCEKNNDSTGLRALRRLMCPYFLNKSPQQTSKYAKFLLTDLVLEESASDRSRERMDLYVTINPSGTRGGGLYRDKYNEMMVKKVKEAIRNQHSGLNHIQLETLVKSISVMTAVHDHNLKSRLHESSSRGSSSDMVGDETRQLIADLIDEVNPFDMDKEAPSDWSFKVKSSPFEGLDYANVLRFVTRVKEQFSLQFPVFGEH